MLKKLKKIPLSEIIFYVCAFVMTFSIFMLFMSPLKWINSDEVLAKYFGNPSFFDLIFVNSKSSEYYLNFSWPIISGIVFLFIFQIILIATVITTSGLLLFKKIKKHTAVCILIGISTLALVCGVLSLCSNLMISKKYLFPDFTILGTFNGLMKLNYGAYLYGITMILASLGSIAAFVLDHYKK